MKKIVITTQNLNEFLPEGEKVLFVDDRTIVTAAVQEELRDAGVELRQASSVGALCQKSGPVECDLLLRQVATILCRDYGVSDPQKIAKLSAEIIYELEKHTEK